MLRKTLVFLLGITVSLLAIGSVVHADVNDFVIKTYDIDYALTRDHDGRSVLAAKETIVAEFPNFDQNHGIERAIPKEYDGHPVSLDIASVTDTSGTAWEYSTYSDSGFEVVRIGSADRYVHGQQTFVIEYNQRDVTRHFQNTTSDEFYWDTNGTDWHVPIERLNVSLEIGDLLRPDLTGQTACYQGSAGSENRCALTGDGTTFTASGQNLAPGENITLAIGFKPHTFEPYQMSLVEKLSYLWLIIQIALVPIGLGIIIWLGVRYSRWSNRTREHDPIAPEYIPPKDASVATAATLFTSTKSFAAQLIDLAVRHYLKVYQTKEKKSIFSQDEYEIEITKPIDDLMPDEQEILRDIFNGQTAVGTRLEMKTLRNNTALYNRMSDNPEKLRKLVRGTYGLRAKDAAKSAWFRRAALLILVASLVLLSPLLLLIAIIAFVLSFTLWPLTDKGLALMRYLKGLKLYIGVAEIERLKMLQSPEGAAKVQVDSKDEKQLVKLYERVLPYAILFGQEKQWNEQLGKYYESTGTAPTWYHGAAGTAAFNASSFSSAISSFSSSAASSSASGGSSGGGSSGGGGGGGGGGGW